MITKFAICRSQYRRMFLSGILALLFVVSGAFLKASAIPENPDEATIRKLNDGYIQAFLKSDVDWYREHLADNFICILGDGSPIDKASFLKDTAEGPGVDDFHLEDLHIRIYGDTALVQAVSVYRRKDGTIGRTRYTDVYVKQAGTWKAVSAQLTRVTAPNP